MFTITCFYTDEQQTFHYLFCSLDTDNMSKASLQKLTILARVQRVQTTTIDGYSDIITSLLATLPRHHYGRNTTTSLPLYLGTRHDSILFVTTYNRTAAQGRHTTAISTRLILLTYHLSNVRLHFTQCFHYRTYRHTHLSLIFRLSTRHAVSSLTGTRLAPVPNNSLHHFVISTHNSDHTRNDYFHLWITISR